MITHVVSIRKGLRDVVLPPWMLTLQRAGQAVTAVQCIHMYVAYSNSL